MVVSRTIAPYRVEQDGQLICVPDASEFGLKNPPEPWIDDLASCPDELQFNQNTQKCEDCTVISPFCRDCILEARICHVCVNDAYILGIDRRTCFPELQNCKITFEEQTPELFAAQGYLDPNTNGFSYYCP